MSALEIEIRSAFAFNAKPTCYDSWQIAEYYENLSLLSDADVHEVLPLLLICELHQYGIQTAIRDMLIYFLDGGKLKKQPDGSWWCNERLHSAELDFADRTFTAFPAEQKTSIKNWLIEYARKSFICFNEVESAILFWRSGCHPKDFRFTEYRRLVQPGIGYALIPQ